MNKIQYYMIITSVLIGCLSGCGNTDVSKTELDNTSVSSVSDNKEVDKNTEESGNTFGKIENSESVDLSKEEKEYISSYLWIWQICEDKYMNGAEFKDLSEIPIISAVKFAEWEESSAKNILSNQEKSSFTDKELQIYKNSINILDKYHIVDESDDKNIEIPIDAVKELLKKYFDNDDIKSYKNSNKEYTLEKDGFYIDEKKVLLSSDRGYGPDYNITSIKQDGKIYTVTEDIYVYQNDIVDTSQLSDKNHYVDDIYIAKTKEYKIGKHEDGSFYLKSMKILKKYIEE